MSLIGDIVGPYALIYRPFRAVADLLPDVVVEEIHTDTMAITDHPVETGAVISDHAFLNPAQIQMRCGWSNSSARDVGYIRLVYEALRELQQARQPFNVATGKRFYSNMLPQAIAVETNPETENVLAVSLVLREIIITGTQMAGLAAASQLAPQQTAPVITNGFKPTSQFNGTVPIFAQ